MELLQSCAKPFIYDSGNRYDRNIINILIYMDIIDILKFIDDVTKILPLYAYMIQCMHKFI